MIRTVSTDSPRNFHISCVGARDIALAGALESKFEAIKCPYQLTKKMIKIWLNQLYIFNSRYLYTQVYNCKILRQIFFCVPIEFLLLPLFPAPETSDKFCKKTGLLRTGCEPYLGVSVLLYVDLPGA